MGKHFMTTLLIISGLLIGLVSLYLFVLRPWHLKWGANKHDLRISLPGDNVVTNPDFNATRGITINSTPENIWKWIIQIGSNLRVGIV